MRLIHALVFPAIIIPSSAIDAQPADSPWPMFHHDARHTGVSRYMGPSAPAIAWSYRPGFDPPVGGFISSAALGSGGGVYVGGSDNNVYAVTSRGALAWSYATGDNVFSSPALRDDGGVCVGGGGGNFYVFSSNGSLVWSYAAGYMSFGAPAIASNGIIYTGFSSSDRLYSFTAAGSLAWSYRAHSDARSPAVGNAGGVYFGSDDNNMYALAANGSLGWSYRTGDSVLSAPSMGNNDTVYIGSSDGRFYAFASTGALCWSYSFGEGSANGFGPLSCAAVADDGRIYIGSADSNLYSFASTGALGWSYRAGDEIPSSPAVGGDGVIYVGSLDYALYAVNPTGALAWSFDMGEWVVASPALGSDSRIYISSLAYFGARPGLLQCIAQKHPLLDLIPSSDSPSVSDPFTIDVTVQTVEGAFDVWGVIIAPGGRIYSFRLGRPGSLVGGMWPLALDVPGLREPFETRLLSIPRISSGAAGSYRVIVGLVPTGLSPTLANAIPDFVDQETVVIH